MRSLRPGVGEALRVTGRPVRLPLRWVLVAWLARHAGRALWWLLSRPARLAGLAVAGAVAWALWRYGWLPVAAGYALTIVGCALWATLHPATFLRWAGWPAWAWVRSRLVYRYAWQPAIVGAGLARHDGPVERLPTLLRVRTVGEADRLLVRMLPGQTVGRWQQQAEALAVVWRALDVRPRAVPGHPDRLELLVLVRDPLRRPVPIATPGDAVPWRALPVGLREDGRAFTLPVLGTHLLVAGETGAGKGSVLWSLLTGLAPGIRAGLVRVWAIDPKGGMELAAGAPLFDRFVYGEADDWPAEVADLLELAVLGMRMRAGRLRRAGLRKIAEPTEAEPLTVVLIDELASLTAYLTDGDTRRRIASALSLLLSQGRAVGVVVVAATQDARKEVVTMRDLFPTRVALRTAEPAQADLILGRGARDRGARTEAIPDGLPGVGYAVVDDAPEPVRVRFAHVTDTATAVLAEQYAPAAA